MVVGLSAKLVLVGLHRNFQIYVMVLSCIVPHVCSGLPIVKNLVELLKMPKTRIWRVRVMRKCEDWVDVQATSALQAEAEAIKVPHVLSVFSKSAIPGDSPANLAAPVGVREDE